jgi:hypothetical protein
MGNFIVVPPPVRWHGLSKNKIPRTPRTHRHFATNRPLRTLASLAALQYGTPARQNFSTPHLDNFSKLPAGYWPLPAKQSFHNGHKIRLSIDLLSR